MGFGALLNEWKTYKAICKSLLIWKSLKMEYFNQNDFDWYEVYFDILKDIFES